MSRSRPVLSPRTDAAGQIHDADVTISALRDFQHASHLFLRAISVSAVGHSRKTLREPAKRPRPGHPFMVSPRTNSGERGQAALSTRRRTMLSRKLAARLGTVSPVPSGALFFITLGERFALMTTPEKHSEEPRASRPGTSIYGVPADEFRERGQAALSTRRRTLSSRKLAARLGTVSPVPSGALFFITLGERPRSSSAIFWFSGEGTGLRAAASFK